MIEQIWWLLRQETNLFVYDQAIEMDKLQF